MSAKSPEKRDLIFVSNRLPYTIDNVDGVLHPSLSSGDLVKALSGNLSARPTSFRWFGWSGVNARDPNERRKISDALGKKNVVAIFLDEQLAYDYYHRFTISMLWPVLHYQSDVEFDEGAWKAYVRVNEIFADTVADEAVNDNLIWIHDYQLLLVPKLLQERLKKQGKHCVIGFTWHTPLPGDDFWKAVPVKKELLEGVLASDVIGLHTDEYKRNFINTCCSNLGAYTKTAGQIIYNEHLTFINTFLLGIDPQIFNDAMQDPYIQERTKELEDKFKNTTAMLGVDRLDHTKRMTQKLQGYDCFLNDHPELKGKVTLVQVAIPSHDYEDEYQELEGDIDTLAEQINEKHATHDWSPLIYMHHSFSFTELTALYCISDVCMLASRRGGMNLVATEYAACQENTHGVLVLSESSGAHSFINAGSLTFRPGNMQEISDSIYRAVTMDEVERGERYEYLRKVACNQTSAKWGQEFIHALANRAHSLSSNT